MYTGAATFVYYAKDVSLVYQA